jgi:predicted Zn-dependent protease
LVAEEIVDGKGKQVAIQTAALLGATAWSNGYGRGYEDQADRVGLRYAFEGGYDVRKGPRLWQRFKEKYGELPKALNFFFSDHSMHKVRAANLEREIRNNYPN